MEGERDRAIERIRALLESAGFYVTDAHHVRPTSFDLLARRDSLLLIVKVLKNIDALDPEEAGRLRALAALFPAAPLVVGQTSGSAALEPGVVYSRYGVPILIEESLRESLLEGVPPFLFSSPGGIFARVDGDRLRELRVARSLSLGALASAAGVSRRTIQLYEEGAGAEVSVVERLETFLGETIALSLDLFSIPPSDPAGRTRGGPARDRGAPGKRTPEGRPAEAPASDRPAGGERPSTGDRMRDRVFRHLDGMGWEVVVTVRCPFDAFSRGEWSREEEILLTSVGSLRTARRRAELLLQLARVAEGHAFYVVPEMASRTAIDGLPLVTMGELGRRRDPRELVDLIAEREGS